MLDLPRQRRLASYRFFEILPALLTWGTFLGMAILAFVAPVVIASIVLLYTLYWFAKSILMSVHLIVGYQEYRRAITINWLDRLKSHPTAHHALDDTWHVIIICNYKEEYPILEASFEAIAQSNYPLNRVIVTLALEERDKERGLSNAKKLEEKFGTSFAKFLYTVHPANLPGEVPGKGGNLTYSAKTILPTLEKMRLDPAKVLVTSLDADHRLHPEYLANVTWAHSTAPNPTQSSYQPLPMFFNNIWHVPIAIRAVSVGSSFWQMIEATRPYRLRNFAAQCQSLALLKETDFWSTQTIVEDGHQYWRSFFTTRGTHQVIPIFVPIYQDAVLSPDGHLMTYREQYLQKRRWAWGVSDVPYVFVTLWEHRRSMPAGAWFQALRLLEGHYTWATTSLVLAFFGWLPTLVNPDFRTTVFSYNFAVIYQQLLTLAMFGMVVSLVLSRLMLPPREKKKIYSNDIVEWILTPFILPITNIAFGSVAAIDAQTRLALGKYPSKFRVTEKAVTRHDLTTVAVKNA